MKRQADKQGLCYPAKVINGGSNRNDCKRLKERREPNGKIVKGPKKHLKKKKIQLWMILAYQKQCNRTFSQILKHDKSGMG